jgi:RNA polymerase sigma factor (TIGR02999 family)
MDEVSEITRLLSDAATGDRAAGERLWALVYEEIRRIAHRELARRGGASLSTTGLVHEAYFKLAGGPPVDWQDRGHFYALACRAMRQVLVDRARHRYALKRGGGRPDVSLDRATVADDRDSDGLLELDEALTRLSALNPRLGQVVECRFFGGLSFRETAEALGISLRTAERDWGRAKAYLYRMLHPAPQAS